jgi:hypothetical protein
VPHFLPILVFTLGPVLRAQVSRYRFLDISAFLPPDPSTQFGPFWRGQARSGRELFPGLLVPPRRVVAER